MIRTKLSGLMTVFFIMVWPALSFAGEVNLPKTGQETCYDENGNVIDCSGTGQDGDIQAGVEWPEPRFADNGDGTVTDHLTGLMWLKDANCFGTSNWQGALDRVADFNANSSNYSCTNYTANYTDWVLPNIIELESLVNAEEASPAAWLNTQGFTDVKSSNYWSASTNAYHTDFAWNVSMAYGSVSYYDKFYYNYVWPVRGGQ
jgi:hypothetical protein